MSQFWRTGERQVFWVCREPRLGEPIHVAVAWDHILVGYCPVSVNGGLLIEVGVPRGAAPLPSPCPHVQRLLLHSGSVMVARQRERDPDGPWALSVELARDEEHRRRLEALQAQDGADECRGVQRQWQHGATAIADMLRVELQPVCKGLSTLDIMALWFSIIGGWSVTDRSGAVAWAQSRDGGQAPPHVMALPFHRLDAAVVAEAQGRLEQHRRDLDAFHEEVGEWAL